MSSFSTSTKLILAASPLLLGSLSGWVASTGPYLERQRTARVSLQPPGWVFSIVWPILYLLMGWSLFRMLSIRGGVPSKSRWVFLAFWMQLALNALWSPVHTYVKNEEASLLLLYLILALSFVTAAGFAIFDGIAAALLYPYLTWLTFASYLSCASIQASESTTGNTCVQ